jgi:hypothetical protein
MDIDTWPIGHMPVLMHNPEIAIVQYFRWLFRSCFSMGHKSRCITRTGIGYASGAEYDCEIFEIMPGHAGRNGAAWQGWVQRAKLDDEIPATSKAPRAKATSPGNRIHPPENGILIERATASIRKPVLVDRIQLRPADREKFSSIQRTSPPL